MEEKDFSNLVKFLSNFTVISAFIGFALGFSFDKIMSALSEGIISPILRIFMSFIGAKKFYFTIRGEKFVVYPILSALITFGIIFGILYAIFAVALKKQMNQIITYRSKNDLLKIKKAEKIEKDLHQMNEELKEDNIDVYKYPIIQ